MSLPFNIKFDHQDNIPVFPIYRGVYFKKNKFKQSYSPDNLYDKKIQDQQKYLKEIQNVKCKLDSLLRQKVNHTDIKNKKQPKLNIPQIVLKQLSLKQESKKKNMPKSLPAIKIKQQMILSQKIPLKEIGMKNISKFQPYSKKIHKLQGQHRYTQQFDSSSSRIERQQKCTRRIITQENTQHIQPKKELLIKNTLKKTSFMTTKEYLIQKLNHIFKVEAQYKDQKQQQHSSTDRSCNVSRKISQSLQINPQSQKSALQKFYQKQVIQRYSPIRITPMIPGSRISPIKDQIDNLSLEQSKELKSIKQFKSMKCDKNKKQKQKPKQNSNFNDQKWQTKLGGWRYNLLQEKQGTLYM